MVHHQTVQHFLSCVHYTLGGMVGLYLGTGQHPGYTAATVTVAVVATFTARRSVERTARATDLSANGSEPVERLTVTRVVKDDLDEHADAHVAGFTLDDVRHHAGTLV